MSLRIFLRRQSTLTNLSSNSQMVLNRSQPRDLHPESGSLDPYSLTAVAIDGVDVEVGGVLILRDGKLQDGDSYVFYTGTYACSDGKWKAEMISQEHTPTMRPDRRTGPTHLVHRHLRRRRCRTRCHSPHWQAACPIRCNVALVGGGLNSSCSPKTSTRCRYGSVEDAICWRDRDARG